MSSSPLSSSVSIDPLFLVVQTGCEDQFDLKSSELDEIISSHLGDMMEDIAGIDCSTDKIFAFYADDKARQEAIETIKKDFVFPSAEAIKFNLFNKGFALAFNILNKIDQYEWWCFTESVISTDYDIVTRTLTVKFKGT